MKNIILYLISLFVLLNNCSVSTPGNSITGETITKIKVLNNNEVLITDKIDVTGKIFDTEKKEYGYNILLKYRITEKKKYFLKNYNKYIKTILVKNNKIIIEFFPQGQILLDLENNKEEQIMLPFTLEDEYDFTKDTNKYLHTRITSNYALMEYNKANEQDNIIIESIQPIYIIKYNNDETKIAYVSNGDLFVTNIDGTGNLKLTSNYNINEICWEENNDYIIFLTENREIYRIRQDGLELIKLKEINVNLSISDLYYNKIAYIDNLEVKIIYF
jgi:hypothetical protein